jgi:hypothetical protein
MRVGSTLGRLLLGTTMLVGKAAGHISSANLDFINDNVLNILVLSVGLPHPVI